MPIQSTVRIKTDESNLIANLGSVFSQSDKVLAEFMQNARRAHATEIRFSLDNDTLTVEDNGDGINDLQNLFTIAESGWDDATMQADRPFGLGFLSALFSANAVQVESRGKMVLFNTADMIDMQAIPINTSIYSGATRITLFGFKLIHTAVQNSVKSYARGFPIRVYMDGTEIDRPHALDNIHSIASEIGQLCLSGIDFEGEEFPDNAYLYFQGLPVVCQGMSQYYQQNIIHLNHDFKVRMPDRDSLIDPTTSLASIKQAIATRWLAYLSERKTLERHEEFVQRYRAMKLFDCTHLLNDVPLLPSACFDELDGTPTRGAVNVRRKSATKTDNHIRQEDIESRQKIVCEHVDNYLDAGCLNGKAFAALMFIARKKWLMLDDARRLHPDHWIHKHVVSFENNLELSYTPLKESGYSFDICYGNLVIVDKFSITVGADTLEITDEAVATAIGEYDDALIIIPGDSFGVEALSQTTEWLDDSDHYRDEWQEEDEHLMRNLLEILRGAKATATVEKALQRQRIAYMENCIGASVVSLFGLKATVRCVDLAEILRQFATRMDLAQADITAATDAEVIVNAFIADLQQAK
jgi:hypothetical protein